MDLVGTQLAVIACVNCKCCKCGCDTPGSSKKIKGSGKLSKKELRARKAASATDVYELSSNSPRRFLPKWSRDLPNPSVLTVNEQNLKEWEKKEKAIWEKRLSASCGSDTGSQIHDGYFPVPLRPLKLPRESQSMYIVSEVAETERLETESGMEQPLLHRSVSEYDSSKPGSSLQLPPPTPFPSATEIHHCDMLQHQDLKECDTVVVKMRNKKNKTIRALTAVPDETGLFSTVLTIPIRSSEQAEYRPKPILIQPKEPPLILASDKFNRKLKKEASRRSLTAESTTSTSGTGASSPPSPTPFVPKKKQSAFQKMRKGFKQIFIKDRWGFDGLDSNERDIFQWWRTTRTRTIPPPTTPRNSTFSVSSSRSSKSRTTDIWRPSWGFANNFLEIY